MFKKAIFQEILLPASSPKMGEVSPETKHNLIKHTCSQHNKLIILKTLNRQAKIF